MASDSSDKTYKPLQMDQTRLMRIDYEDGPYISCVLEVFVLTERPPYEALSYCWTKAEATCEIRLNGHPVWVRPNLYDYLKVMYEERQTCWIFVDALCINQEDGVEKGHQVKLMGQIYEHAEGVVAWLGAKMPELWAREGMAGMQWWSDLL